MPPLVEPTTNRWQRHPNPKTCRQSVRDVLERSTSRLVTLDRGGIVKTPMNPFGIARKRRARLGGPIADGNHVVEGLAEKPTQGLRVQIGGIDVKAIPAESRSLLDGPRSQDERRR
jgi:hypothetical protein